MSSSLTAQTKYPYELIKGNDTTVTLLKSQAVYLNQTTAKQKIKLNEIKTEYDSTKAEYTVLDSIIKNQQPIVKVDTVVLTKEVPLLIQPTAKGLSRWGMGFSGGALNVHSDLSNVSINGIQGSSQFISYHPDHRWEIRNTLTQGNIKGSRY